jgi:aspartyl-tRNA(Asn)/glutamyl-tRNA(Gln) amidotransferase subunit B
MEYEIKRQEKVLNEGGTIVQETRLWDPDKGVTAPMRSKEEAHDYRYFPEPDLVPLRITTEMVEAVRKTLPELPAAKHARFMEEYGLPGYDAGVLTAEKALAEFFEAAVKAQVETTGLSGKALGKETSNWVTVEWLGLLHRGKPGVGGGTEPMTIIQSPVSPKGLAELLVLKRRGEVSGPIAKSVLEEMFETGQSAVAIVKAKGLTQVSDEGALETVIDEVMVKSPAQLAQYRSGKEALFGFFVGQAMKASGGKANPAKVNELLKRKLAG